MTYLYHCDSCVSQFEAEQRISEDALKVCNLCGKKNTVSRIPNNEGGFILSGSGWTPKYGKE